MQFTAQELAARVAALQTIADDRGLPWRARVAALRRRDPFTLIGVFADVLQIDYHSALHGHMAGPAPGPGGGETARR
jgi:hypothetical protein